MALFEVGGATKDGDFVIGQPAQSGVYLFSNLVLGSDSTWRMQSQYLPSIPGYEGYPTMLLNMTGLASLGRAANRGRTAGGGRVPWLQIARTSLKFGSAGSSLGARLDQRITLLNAGLDFDLAPDFVAGVSVHYADGVADITSPNGAARIRTEGFGVGGSLRWHGESGLYVAAQARLMSFSSDLPGATGNRGIGRSASVELGQALEMAPGWRVTPSASLHYSSVSFREFTGSFGETVALTDGETLHGRIGATIERVRTEAICAGS